jgi:hypothetical protein
MRHTRHKNDPARLARRIVARSARLSGRRRGRTQRIRGRQESMLGRRPNRRLGAASGCWQPSSPVPSVVPQPGAGTASHTGSLRSDFRRGGTGDVASIVSFIPPNVPAANERSRTVGATVCTRPLATECSTPKTIGKPTQRRLLACGVIARLLAGDTPRYRRSWRPTARLRGRLRPGDRDNFGRCVHVGRVSYEAPGDSDGSAESVGDWRGDAPGRAGTG